MATLLFLVIAVNLLVSFVSEHVISVPWELRMTLACMLGLAAGWYSDRIFDRYKLWMLR
jgi:hypothetical protein